MKSVFWTNTIWFVLLALTTIIELLFIFIKAEKKRAMLAFYFTIAGITFSIEALICCFLSSYEYFPMIIPNSPFDDNLAGNLFSQFSISATILLAIVFKLKKYWFPILSFIYCMIEELFLRLGIYKHNWYRTWITFIGIIILFIVIGKFQKRVFSSKKDFYYYISILLGLYTLHMPTVIWTFRLTGIQNFNENVLSSSGASYSLFSLINLFLLSTTITFIHLKKFNWRIKSLAIVFLYLVLYLAYKFNIMYVREGWFLIFSTIDIFAMYLCVYILEKLYSQIK